jgi:hypothetical protein
LLTQLSQEKVKAADKTKVLCSLRGLLTMKKSLYLLASLLILTSCAKEEFAVNKGTQSGSVNPIVSTSTQLCSQHTLVSPQVDILLLWDNSSSFNFVTTASKSSMTKLIESVSEKFDYHILSVPLVPANTSNTLFEGILVAKDQASVTGAAASILKTKEQAVASLAFSSGPGGSEAGIDRATKVIEANRTNGIFRNGAYTIIVVMSNEDDKGCSLGGPICNNSYDLDKYITPRVNKLLCLRGNTAVDCNGSGYTQATSLKSSMMRFINISPLTMCSSGLNKMNYSYRKAAKTIYEAEYTPDESGKKWPTANDHLSPDVTGAPDSYNLCSIDFSHIFDGVNTAIKQTLIKHKYEYWPVAGLNADLDPDTLRVVRSDSKILKNNTDEANPEEGYQYIGDQNNHATRVEPTAGEAFTGKMIQLFGNDKIVYPDCLTVTYDAKKVKYGYIYLKYGQPKVDTIEVRINGQLVPQSTTNGWDYMGNQFVSALDANLKVYDMPAGTQSGYVIRLNGSYQFSTSGSATAVTVYYNSITQ